MKRERKEPSRIVVNLTNTIKAVWETSVWATFMLGIISHGRVVIRRSVRDVRNTGPGKKVHPMGFKMGVAGCGSFGNCFVPLFKAHPLVDEVVIADLVPERVEEFSNKYGTGLMQ